MNFLSFLNSTLATLFAIILIPGPIHGQSSVHGESVNFSGVYGYSSNASGISGNSITGSGVNGFSEDASGVRGSSINSYGVFGTGYLGGVYGDSQYGYGVRALSINNYGMYGYSSGHHGAYFQGKNHPDYADVILGATDETTLGDNGVLSSDPAYPGSDLYLKSYHSVVVQLDADTTDEANATEFIIKNDLREDIFRVQEDGDVILKNGTVAHTSNIHSKEKIIPVRTRKILTSLKHLPIYEWQYIGQNRRHIGPMAQDFHKAFNLGDDETIISSIDLDGIALAAIQAQQTYIHQLQNEIADLKNKVNQLEDLQKEIDQIKSMLRE